MAKNAKPSIERLGKEGKITFLEYNNEHRFDEIDTLIDGNINKHTGYGVLLAATNTDRKIVFELYQASNIWAYGQSYSDGSGSTPSPINLYKKNDNEEFEPVQKKIPTKNNEWYLLANSLKEGIYKIEWTSNYTMFTEWYIEFLEIKKYLIQDKNNILYRLEDNSYTENLVPKMTSNITPSGIVSASSEYNATYQPWKAFNESNVDAADCWASNTSNPSWLQYDFGANNETTITKYDITSRNYNDPTASLKSWTFEASNNTEDWVILDKRDNESQFGINETRTYSFSNINKYRYYRINIISNHGQSYHVIGLLKMFEKFSHEIIDIKENLTEDLFKNKGFSDPTIIQNQQINQKGIYGVDKSILGDGKLFEFNLNNEMKAIKNIE